jgi:hypothetical protein
MRSAVGMAPGSVRTRSHQGAAWLHAAAAVGVPDPDPGRQSGEQGHHGLPAQRIRGGHGGERAPMFAWLRRRRVLREKQRLERLHLDLLTAARDLQRKGDIQAFAAKTAEAEAAEQQLDRFLAEHGLAAAPPR